jgi:hypothetical protein
MNSAKESGAFKGEGVEPLPTLVDNFSYRTDGFLSIDRLSLLLR